MPQKCIDPLSSARCATGHNIAVTLLCVQPCPVIGRVARSANQGCSPARGPNAVRSISDIDANASSLHRFVVRNLVHTHTLTHKHTPVCTTASILSSATVTTWRVRMASPCSVGTRGGPERHDSPICEQQSSNDAPLRQT